MDLQALMYFRTVAEMGTISKAAAYLRIAQPALSRHIQKLEHSLGVELLQRRARGVDLTIAGRQLLEKTADVEAALGQISREVSSYAHEVVGPLSVGIQPSLSVSILPGLVRSFRAEHPKVELYVAAGYSTDLIDGLLDESLDLAFVDTPSHTPRELATFPLWMETLHLIGSKGAPAELFESGPMSLADAFRLPLVLPTARYSVRRLIDATAASEHLKAMPMLEVDGPDLIYALVKEGIGFTILSSVGWAAGMHHSKLRSVETTPAIYRPLSVVARRSVLGERKVQTFVSLFKAAAQAAAAKEEPGRLRLTFSEGASGAPKPAGAAALTLVSSRHS